MSDQRPMRAWLLVVALLMVAIAPQQAEANGEAPGGPRSLELAEREIIALPCEFDVPPHNRLYVYGERIQHAVLTLEPGDSLRVNGIAVRPLRPGPPPPLPTQSDWAETYGQAPMFQRLLTAGRSPEEAGREFLTQQGVLRQRIRQTYAELVESLGEETQAVERAFELLPELDTEDMLDWSQEIRVGEGCLWLSWKGRSGFERVPLGRDVPHEHRGAPTPEWVERGKRLFATTVFERMSKWAGPCWYFITHGGTTLLCGENEIGGAADQIQHARETGEVVEGPLPERTVILVLQHEGDDD